MAFDYGPLRATASRLIDNFGATITINRPVEGQSEPIPGTVVRQGTHLLATSGEFKAVKVMDKKDFKTGETVSTHALNLVVADGPFDPKQGDTLAFGGADYKVMEAEKISPAGGSAIVFKLGCGV